jgi:hypothetical protein
LADKVVTVNSNLRGHKIPYRIIRDPTELYRGVPQMVIDLCRFLAYVRSGRCIIVDRDNPEEVPLKPRTGQLQLIVNMLDQAVARQPLRQVVPKYRRHGMSTIVQALFRFLCKTKRNRNARMIAHTDEAANKIFAIAKLMHERDDGELDNKSVKSSLISFTLNNSTYQCLTGLGNYQSSGDTLHYVHVSEYAKFMNTSKQDQRAMNSILNAVAQTSPETIIVIESSGQGPHGDFPKRCRSAYQGKGSYGCVFLPWVIDKTLSLDEDGLPDEFEPGLSGYELILRDTYGATDGQLAWRRQKLDDDFPGANYNENPPEFAWDYPVHLEECFGVQSGRIWPMFSRERNVGVLDPRQFPPGSYRARFIDWGTNEDHKFACLWVWICPKSPPGLCVHPSCETVIEEFSTYRRDERTGDRLKVNDHTCDAFRYGVVTVDTSGFNGFMYIYRELIVADPNEAVNDKLTRRIHQMSGWRHPSGDPDHPDIAKYEPGPNGEKFRLGVADRNRGDNRRQFNRWGIKLIPHAVPHVEDNSRGEVEDGLARCAVIISGESWFKTQGFNFEAQLLQKVANKLVGPGRRRMLTKAERQALERFKKSVNKRSTKSAEPSSLTFIAQHI